MEPYFDPYRNVRFRIVCDGRPVAGVSRISALRRSTEVVRHSEGGDSGRERKSPGKTEYDAVTLERGLTADPDFQSWAASVSSSGRPGPAADFRRDLRVEVFDERGAQVVSYRLLRCWVSEYQALPDLDSSSNTVLIETIKLEIEGWEVEPASAAAGA
jgi:phage tail-like protein